MKRFLFDFLMPIFFVLVLSRTVKSVLHIRTTPRLLFYFFIEELYKIHKRKFSTLTQEALELFHGSSRFQLYYALILQFFY